VEAAWRPVGGPWRGFGPITSAEVAAAYGRGREVLDSPVPIELT